MPAIEREVVTVKPPPGLVHHFAPEVAVPGLGKTNCRDAAGNLIVADSENYTICKIEAEAIVTTIPGGAWDQIRTAVQRSRAWIVPTGVASARTGLCA